MSTEEEKVSTEPASEKEDPSEIPVEKKGEVAPTGDVAAENPEADTAAAEKKVSSA